MFGFVNVRVSVMNCSLRMRKICEFNAEISCVGKLFTPANDIRMVPVVIDKDANCPTK